MKSSDIFFATARKSISMGALLCTLSIAALPNCSAAASSPGTLVMWGDVMFPYVPPGTTFTNINCGIYNNLALTSEGTLVGWGDNLANCLRPPPLSNVVSMSMGEWHGVALKSDGTVAAWGYLSTMASNVAPEGLSNVIAVAAGQQQFCLALKSDGTVVSWGDPTVAGWNSGIGLSNLTAIAAGMNGSIGLKSDGTVVCWGTPNNTPPGLSNVVRIAIGNSEKLALRSDGTVIAWGGGSWNLDTVPPEATNGMAIAAGDDHCVLLRADGTVVQWGSPYAGSVPSGLTNVAAISARYKHTVALKKDGTLVAWGAPSSACTLPLGRENFVIDISAAGEAFFPWNSIIVRANGSAYAWQQDASSTSNLVAAAAGKSHFVGLQNDGHVIDWGSLPGDVPADLNSVVAVAAGRAHGIALRNNGTVVAWGDNSRGQTNVPSGLTDVIAVSSLGSSDGSLALRSDGTVVGWPASSFDPLILGLSNVVALANGACPTNGLVVLRDGSVAKWGDNTFGQNNVPAEITNVVSAAISEDHCLVILADRTVRGWGSNLDRGLASMGTWFAPALDVYANVDLGQSTIPPGLSNVVAVAAGYGASMAIVGIAPRLGAVTFLSGKPVVRFRSFAGMTYTVEYAAALPGPWIVLPGGKIAGTGQDVSVVDNLPGDSARFYRVSLSTE